MTRPPGDIDRDAQSAYYLVRLVEHGLDPQTSSAMALAWIRGVSIREAKRLIEARDKSATVFLDLLTARGAMVAAGMQPNYIRCLAEIAGWTEERARMAFEVAAQAGWIEMPSGDKRGGEA